jgi:hypothetical protein
MLFFSHYQLIFLDYIRTWNAVIQSAKADLVWMIRQIAIDG